MKDNCEIKINELKNELINGKDLNIDKLNSLLETLQFYIEQKETRIN